MPTFNNMYGYEQAIKRRKQRAARTMTQPKSLHTKRPVRPPKIAESSLYDPAIQSKQINWSLNVNVMHDLAGRLQSDPLTILKLETGVGKTVLAVGALGSLQEQRGRQLPFVVIAPRQVVSKHGWQSTLLAWNDTHPDNQLHPITIDAPDHFANILSNPTSLRQLVGELGADGVIVIDEIHNYKTPTSKRSKMLQRLSHYHKLGLSATPLTNNVVTDAISYLVMGGRYSSKTAFERESGLNQRKNAFGEYMIYTGDPPRISEALWPFYPVMQQQLASIIVSPVINTQQIVMPTSTLNLISVPCSEELAERLTSLRQAFSKGAFDSAIDYMMATVETINSDETRLNTLVDLITQPGVKQPLVFYWHVSVLHAIERTLTDRNIPYQIISGSHPASRVDTSRDTPILIQYQSGSEGIELPMSNTSVFYQNQHAYSKLQQARGRNIRRGSTHHVTQYNLVTDTPFDQRIFTRLMERKDTSLHELAQILVQDTLKE